MTSHAASGAANIYVSATGNDGSCARSASPVSYANASGHICATISQACSIAVGGDTVIIENGTYSGSTLDSCTGKSSTVTFTTEPGQACTYSAATPFASLPGVNADTSCPVTFTSELSMRGNSTSTPATSNLKNLKFTGMYFSDVYIKYAYNIALDHDEGHFWFVRSADTVSITNGDWGNQFDGTCPTVGSMGAGTPSATNITISGNIIHDERHDISPTTHPDGMFIQESDGITISDNVFYRNDVIPLYVNSIFNGLVQNITITNNVIHTSTDHTSGSIGPGVATGNTNTLSLGNNGLVNATVAFNTVSGAIRRQESPGPTTNLKVYGNVATEFIEESAVGCSPGGTYDYNVWYLSGAGTCGAHDIATATDPFTSDDVLPDELTLGDLQAKAGSTPIDFIPASFCTANAGVCPSTDFIGTSRPQNSIYDAGAYENIPSANVWVSTTGNDSTCARGNQSLPCATFNKAYTIAQAGDIVQVEAGNYPAQTINATAKSSAVTFKAQSYTQPASAADVLSATTDVTVASLEIHTDHVHIYGIEATDHSFANGTETMSQLETLTVNGSSFTDVLIDGWRGHVADAYSTGTTFDHMEIGNANYCTATVEERDAAHLWAINVPSNNDSIINSVLHDWYDGSANPDGACGQGSSGAHDDCIQSPGGDNMTISGDLFYKCGSSSIIQMGEFSGGVMGNIYIENDFFGNKPTEFNILSMGQGHCAGLLIRNNVFDSGNFDNNGGCTGTPTQTNNIMLGAVSSCDNGGSFSGTNNIFVPSGGTTCGTNAKRCTPSFVNGLPPNSGESYWLPDLSTSDTCAKDAGSTSSYPATDFYGTIRPQGSAPDAGAYEIAASGSSSSGPSIGDLNSDGHVNITDLSILLSHYGQSATPSQGDCNSDGIVNISDLSILLSHYGT